MWMRRLFLRWINCSLEAPWWPQKLLGWSIPSLNLLCSAVSRRIWSTLRRLPHHCLYILQAIIVFSLIIICKQGGISFRCTHSVMSVQAFDSMQNQSNKQGENSYIMIFDPAQPLQQRTSFHLPLGMKNKKLILKCKLLLRTVAWQYSLFAWLGHKTMFTKATDAESVPENCYNTLHLLNKPS